MKTTKLHPFLSIAALSLSFILTALLPLIIAAPIIQAQPAPPAADPARLTTARPATNTATLELISLHEFQGEARAVAIDGNYAYVGNGWYGLHIVNISNPFSPTAVSDFDTHQARDVVVANGYAYIADFESGLRIIDISNPITPVQTSVFNTLGIANNLFLSGTIAYVADQLTGLHIIDVSNPYSPTEIGSYNPCGACIDVAVVGNYAYMADEQVGLRIVDISNPFSPTQVSLYGQPAAHLATENNYVYYANEIIDVSNPAQPRQIGYYETPNGGGKLTVNGNYLYSAHGASGIIIVDVANPSRPVEIARYACCEYIHDIVIANSYIYVSDGSQAGSADASLPILRLDGALSSVIAPSNLTVDDISQSRLQLTWTDNATDETYFLIERSPNGLNDWTEVSAVPADQTVFQDNNLLCETEYFYRAIAYRENDGRYSANTNIVSTTTHNCSSRIVFEDTFSTDKGWVNDTSGYFFRDAMNKRLDWEVRRDTRQLYYIPLPNSLQNEVSFRYRINIDYWANNNTVLIGLAETLTGTGLYANAGFMGGGTSLYEWYMSSSGSCAAGGGWFYYSWPNRPDTYVDYNTDTWYQVEMAAKDDVWTLSVYEDDGVTLRGQLSDVMPCIPIDYNYFMIMNAGTGDWPWGEGWLDDIEVNGRVHFSLFFTDTFDGPDIDPVAWNLGGDDPDAAISLSDGLLHLSTGASPGGSGWLTASQSYRADEGFIALEMRAQSTAGAPAFWGFQSADGADKLGFGIDLTGGSGGLPAVTIIAGQGGVYTSAILSQISPIAWHTYRIEIDGSRARFYVDGQLQFTYLATTIWDESLQLYFRQESGGQNESLSLDFVEVKGEGGPPNSVRVVDETGLPVANALIYRNGQPVNNPDGVPRRTGSDGYLAFTSLLPGETLAALQPVYEQPTAKAAHNPGDGADFAFRIYRTSMPVSNGGDVSLYTVDAKDKAHTLSVSPDNTLVLFNIVASVEWDADNETGGYIDQLKIGLEQASNFLYDATDGQMAFGWASIYDNGAHWADADIQIRAHNHTWPHAHIGGINTTGASQLIYKGLDPEPGQIVLGRYFNGNGSNQGPWSEHNGYATIVHEFGHYGLFLFDEYFYYEGDENHRVAVESKCSYFENHPASLMDYQYTKSEFCNRPEHYPEYYGGPPTRQTQVYGANESSWATIRGVFSDALQAISPNSPPWSITAPPERNADLDYFMTGPTQPPLDGLLTIEDFSGVANAFSRKPIVVKYEGAPIWQALVSLHQTGGAVLDQGLTDQQGEIDILGAGIGDIIKVRTPDNGLAGNLTVANANQEEIDLAPVSGKAGAYVITDTIMPLITIIPRSDGSTMDYFAANTVELSSTVNAQILGAQAPPVAQKAMSFDTMQKHYFVTFNGYSSGTLTGLTFQMTTTAALSGFVEVAITHDRGWTEGGPNELDLTSTDGNLTLNASGGSFSNLTYVTVNPTNAQPSSAPTNKVIIGQPYSLQASGALTGSQKPMALDLQYQPLSLGSVEEATLNPYYWSPLQQEWLPVLSYTLNITANRVSASIDFFGIYVLMGDKPPPKVDSITPEIGTLNLTLPATIKGDNFESGAQVIFESVDRNIPIDIVFFIDRQTLTIQIPNDRPPGLYNVTVVNPDGLRGTLTNGFQMTGAALYLPLVLK